MVILYSDILLMSSLWGCGFMQRKTPAAAAAPSLRKRARGL